MMRALGRFPLSVAVAGAVAAALLVALYAADVAAQEGGALTEGWDITVQAEVLEAGAPVQVEATAVTEDDAGRPAHGVRVTWTDSARAMLDDVRFTHHVTAQDGDGDLVLAGRGCGADWSDTTQQVTHVCTADLLLIELGPGETHEYPVRIHTEVGPLRLAEGTYVVEQPVEWWRPADETDRRQFTIRLTYEVAAIGPDTGTLTPEPAPTGVSIATWGGGSIDRLPLGATYWVSHEGALVGYVPGAPAFVNAEFRALFPGARIPSGTALIVAR